MKKINIGIIGFGNIGCGVVKILGFRKSLLAQKIETEIVIKKICDKDLARKRNVAIDKALLTTSADEIINDPVLMVADTEYFLEEFLSFIKRHKKFDLLSPAPNLQKISTMLKEMEYQRQ